MCTSIVEIATAAGCAKDGEHWFDITQTVVSYDHPLHAFLEEAIIIDFVNPAMGAGARTAAELTLESAKALHAALGEAIAKAEEEESERWTGEGSIKRLAAVA